MSRERLRNRRASITETIDWGGQQLHVSVAGIGRLPGGAAASPIGAIIDRALEIETMP